MPNQCALQYEHVRKLLQCGHAYAKIADYDASIREAIEHARIAMETGTNEEVARWNSVCQIIDHLGELVFGDEWKIRRKLICKEIAEEK